MNVLKRKKIILSMLLFLALGALCVFSAFFIFENQKNELRPSIFAQQISNINNEQQADNLQYWEQVRTSGSQKYENVESIGVQDANELATVMQNINSGNKTYGTIYLIDDIDLTGKIWTPIKQFSGTFDGRGYTIKGLTIDETITASNSSYGFFGQTTNGAIIKNVTFTGVNIETNLTNAYVGAIVGKAENTFFINCGTSGVVSGGIYAGGIAGYASNVNIVKCFSYASVSTSNYFKMSSTFYITYAGGIAGFATVNSNIQMVFHYGNVFTSAKLTSELPANTRMMNLLGGIVGLYSSNPSDGKPDTITDFYCSSDIKYRYGTPSQTVYSVNSDSINTQSAWIKDETGIMHGIANKDVLRGVGNIVVNYKKLRIDLENCPNNQIIADTNDIDVSYDVSYKEESVNLNTTIYNILTLKENLNTSLTSDENYFFEKVQFARVVSCENDDLITTGNIFSKKSEDNSYRFSEKIIEDVNLKTKQTTLLFNGKDEFNFSAPENQATYQLDVIKSFQGEYNVTAYERGQYKQVNFEFQQYVDVLKTGYEDVSKTYNIQLVDGTKAEQAGTSSAYYVPYNEPYIITFTDAYFDKITQIGIGAGGFEAGTTVLFDVVGTSPEQNCKYISSTIKESTDETYYFNNLQTVTIQLNANEAWQNIVQNSPAFICNKTNVITDDIKVFVMVDEELSNGVGYINNNTKVNIINDGAITITNFYPLWSKFIASSISMIEQNPQSTETTIFTNTSGHYAGDLSLRYVTKWEKSNQSETIWKINWELVNEDVTITSTNKEMFKTFPNESISPITNEELSQNAKVEFELNPGYILKGINIVHFDLQDGTSITTEFSYDNLSKETTEKFSYFGCSYSLGANNENLKIHNEFTISFTQNNNPYSYCISFNHLVGITKIELVVAEKTFAFELNASLDSTLDGYNGCTVSITDVKVIEDSVTSGCIGATTSITFDAKFNNTITITAQAKPGYYLQGLDSSNIKCYDKAGNEITTNENGQEGISTMFKISNTKVDEQNITITITVNKIINSSIESFKITLPVFKNTVSVTAFVQTDNITDFSSALLNEIVWTSSTKEHTVDTDGKLSTTFYTDEEFECGIQLTGILQEYAKVNGVKVFKVFYININEELVEERVELAEENFSVDSDGSTYINLTISQGSFENNTKLEIVFLLAMPSAKITLTDKITDTTSDTTTTCNFNDKLFTYGTKIRLSYDNNDLKVEIYDPNVELNDNFYIIKDLLLRNDIESVDVIIDGVSETLTNNKNTKLEKTIEREAFNKDIISIEIVPNYKTSNVYANIVYVYEDTESATLAPNISNQIWVDGKQNSQAIYGQNIRLIQNDIAGYNSKGWVIIPTIDTSLSSILINKETNCYPTETELILGQDIEAKRNIFFIAVYEAKILPVSFNLSNYNDGYNEITFDANYEYNSATWEYGTKNLKINGNLSTTPPILTCDPLLYNFAGWKCDLDAKYVIKYESGEFKINDLKLSNLGNSTNATITFSPMLEPAEISYELYDDINKKVVATGVVTYKQNNYSSNNLPTRLGYSFKGWTYGDKLLLEYKNGEFVLNEFIITLTDETDKYVYDEENNRIKVTLTPVWEPQEINLIFDAGNGVFANGKQTIDGTVVYGTNIYNSDAFNNLPSLTSEYVTYNFKYFILKGSPTNIVYSSEDLNNFKYENTQQTTFVACYEIVDVNAEIVAQDDATTWVYDGQAHRLEVKEISQDGINVEYIWQKKNANGEWQTLENSTNSFILIKNVAESGVYRCNVIVNAKNYNDTNIYIISSKSKLTNEVEIIVQKREITFEDNNGQKLTSIVKEFDNTNKVPNGYVFAGNLVIGEQIELIATYSSIHVANNIQMQFTLKALNDNTNIENYFYNEISGEITPYVINYNVNGNIYQIGDTSEEIVISEKYYNVATEDLLFLQNNGMSVEAIFKTSKNEVGTYTFNGNEYKINIFDFIVKTNSSTCTQDFTYEVAGQFTILNPDLNAVSINLMGVCEDKANIDIQTLISFNIDSQLFEQIQNNNTNNVKIIAPKQQVANQTLYAEVNIDSNYWVKKITVNDVEINLDDVYFNNILHYQIDSENQSAIIKVYITTLNTVNFEYNLASGETIANQILETKYAYQKTIDFSIENYGAVLPEPIRNGFNFVGWAMSNGTIVSKETVWIYKDVTLYASWQIANIDVERLVDDVLFEEDVFTKTYNAKTNVIKFNITNKNESALTYTYIWQKNNINLGNNTDKISVKHVEDSALYSLTIRATSVSNNNLYKEFQTSINVQITPLNIFANTVRFDKEYDKTNLTKIDSINFEFGEIVTVNGRYLGIDAGSKINLDSNVWSFTVDGSDAKTSNYNLNLQNIESESAIYPKEVSLNIGNINVTFNGNVYEYNGTYVNENISFDYTIKTTSSNVGTYNQFNDNIIIELRRDKISNFIITVSGEIIIVKKVIENITWAGRTNVTFDGQYHSVIPNIVELQQYIIFNSITYSSEHETVTYDISEDTSLNIGVVSAGTYTVTCDFVQNENIDIQQFSTVLTINKKIIDVKYKNDNYVYEKTYDSTRQVLTSLDFDIIDKVTNTSILNDQYLSKYLPEFTYEFETVLASQNSLDKKDIVVTLNINNAFSNNYLLNDNNTAKVKGIINKKQVDITLNSIKQFDNKSFVVNYSNVSIPNLMPQDELNGTITFTQIVNVGVYYDLNEYEKVVNLETYNSVDMCNYKIEQNYILTFLNSSTSQEKLHNKLEITKANIKINIVNDKQYVYTGKEVKIEYTLQSSNVLPQGELKFRYQALQGASTDNGKAVQIGMYTFECYYDGLDANNFTIEYTSDNVFEITKRPIKIKFSGESETKHFEYQVGQNAVYSSELFGNESVLSLDTTLGEGDVISWTFTTTHDYAATYKINDIVQVVSDIYITKDGVDFTKNYQISYSDQSKIVINKKILSLDAVSFNETETIYDGYTKEIIANIHTGFIQDGEELIISVSSLDSSLTYGKFLNMQKVSLNNDDDVVVIEDLNNVKYSGLYKFNLSLNNYEIANADNRQYEYKINQVQLSVLLLNSTKTYDGNNVLNADNFNVIGVVEVDGRKDNVTIQALFDDKNVGENKKITLNIVADGFATIEMLESYKLPSANYTGSITPRPISFSILNDGIYTTYYTKKPTEIDISQFDVSNLVSYENIQGNIILNKTDVGSYDLSTLNDEFISFNLQIFDLYDEDVTQNYEFSVKSITNSVVNILQARVVVQVSENNLVYNGEIQYPKFTYTIYDGLGEIDEGEIENVIKAKYILLPNISESDYIENPVDAGMYRIKLYAESLISEKVPNYVLIDDKGNTQSEYILQNTYFTINKRLIAINVKEVINFNNNGEKATYVLQNSDIIDPSSTKNNGLVEGHNLKGLLSTNNSINGTYTANNVLGDNILNSTNEVYLTEFNISPYVDINGDGLVIYGSDKIDISKNYSLESLTATIIIRNLYEKFDISEISNFVYDKQDKVTTGQIKITLLDTGATYIYGADAEMSNLQYNSGGINIPTQTCIDAGEYSFDITIDNIGKTTIEFTVEKRTLNLNVIDYDKVYDGNSDFINDISLTNIISGDDVSLNNVMYVNSDLTAVSDVGQYKVHMELMGEDSLNYQLPTEEIFGRITKRPISLYVDEHFVYNGQNLQIDSSKIKITGSLASYQTLDGYVTLKYKDAQVYNFDLTNLDVSNLKVVTNLFSDVTSNYDMTFISTVTIEPISVNITVENVDLTYNGNQQSIYDYLILSSVQSELYAEAQKAVNIVYSSLTAPINAGQYVATISSKSQNYVFVVLDYENNQIDFEIKKKDLSIYIEKEIVYNPTSEHKENLLETDFVGLIEGQIVNGTFKLYQSGLGVGTYYVSNDEVIFENVSIIVNGENIIQKNYQLAGYDGFVKITEFNVQIVNLKTSTYVYQGYDLSSTVEIQFVDANGQLQTITNSSTQFGTFSILDGEAKNVGTYSVEFEIYNCNTENNILNFEIIKKEIKNISYLKDKVYSGNSYVYNFNGLTSLISTDVYFEDDVEIFANYVDKDGLYTSDCGTHSILFEIKNKNELPQSNYSINLSSSGTITQREIFVQINKKLSYSTTNSYSINADDIVVLNSDNTENRILSTDTLTGYVTFTKNQIGSVDIDTLDISNLAIHNTSLDKDVTSNYSITIRGNIEVIKSKVELSFEGIESEYVYNAQNVQITPVLNLVDSTDNVLPEINVTYTSLDGYNSSESPINVGIYTATFTLISNNYEMQGQYNFEFSIIPYQITINTGDVQDDVLYKIYGETDPLLSYTIQTIYNESVIIYFARESGENVGRYDLIIENWDNKNYTILASADALKDLFEIKKADLLNVVILNTQNNIDILQKIYDNQNIGDINISQLEYLANDEEISGSIHFDGIDVGHYNMSSYTVTCDNFLRCTLTCELQFTINAKEIVLSSNDADKIYDATNVFFGSIEIYDNQGQLLDINQYPISASATYSQQDVGNDILLNVLLQGDEASNYAVKNTLSGNIFKRDVLILPNSNQSSVYGDKNITISYTIQDENVNKLNSYDNEIDGNLVIQYKEGYSKFIAGNYEIKSQLNSKNLNLVLQTGIIYTINQRELTVVNNQGFNKVYDGNDSVIGTLILNNLVDGDDVSVVAKYDSASVGNNKIITFALFGNDALNYFVNDMFGAITDKAVKLIYQYTEPNFDMINYELMQYNDLLYSNLVYGESIKTLPKPQHEGYEFVGWYLDGNLIDENTIINKTIWDVDTLEKTAYAKWQIKEFSLLVKSATKVNGIFTLQADKQGGTLLNINGSYEYGEIVSLSNVASANSGYDFIGYSYDINWDADIGITSITIEAKENIIYAKFVPKTLLLTIVANGGMFLYDSGWEYSSDSSSISVSVEFNTNLAQNNIKIPSAIKTGYSQVKGQYQTTDGEIISFSEDTMLTIDYYPSIILNVVWNSNEYQIILDSNGGYFNSYDTTTWNVELTDEFDRAVQISKNVVFNEVVGTLPTPVREGYSFSTWDNSQLNENFVWNYIETTKFGAVWNENEYTLTVNCAKANIEITILDGDDNIITVQTVNSSNTETVLKVYASYKAIIVLKEKSGYLFVNWSSNLESVNNSTNKSITINGFVDNYVISANFACKDNTITLRVNNKDYGIATFGEYSTAEIGEVSFVAKTESQVDITVLCNEGYKVYDWELIADEMPTLSNNINSEQRTLSNFVTDVIVIVNLVPKTNKITILSDQEKGSFSIENLVSNVNSYDVEIATEQTLTFTVVANHGYKVDTNINSWIFDTTSLNKGVFVVVQKGDAVNVTFTGFTYDGTITIPFVYDTFTIKVISIKHNDTFEVDMYAQNIVELINGQNVSMLNSNSSFEATYKSQVTLTPTNDVYVGYSFSSWSSMNDKEYSLTFVDGLLSINENNQIEFQINKDFTLYLIYSINKYNVNYSVNYNDRGSLTINGVENLLSYTQNIKYGYDAMPVLAVEDKNNYFYFEKWVMVLEDGNYQDVTNENLLEVNNITKNCNYVAVFVGKPITVTINVILPQSERFTNEDIDFAELSIAENDNTTLVETSKENYIITYTISSLTGEDITIDLIEKNGYEFSGLMTDPLLRYENLDTNYVFKNLLKSTTIDITMKAKTHTVTFAINGIGADIYDDANKSTGIVNVENSNNKILNIEVKNGGSIVANIYILIGYKMLDNSYFELQIPITDSNTYNAYSTTELNNITTDSEIIINIEPQKYQVTFNYNYSQSPENVISSISYGESQFNPILDSQITSPERYKYIFVAWNTKIDGTGLNYYFDSLGIYTIEKDNGENKKIYGFKGSTESQQSISSEYDLECTLYAMWEKERYRVDIVFVPNTAINQSNLAYSEIFPNIVDRFVNYNDNNQITGISYAPGAQVTIVAPLGLNNYRYCGWSYSLGITDKEQLNKNQYSQIMGEENITIYLYYEMSVNVVAYVGGVARISKDSVLYNEKVQISAVCDSGYEFLRWLEGSNEIENSTPTMELTITKPTTFYAEFLGKQVNVIIEQVEHAKLKISDNTLNQDNVYRVGDIIRFDIYDLEYGYYHRSWLGEFSENIYNNSYQISASDLLRGYVKFKLDIAQKTLNVQFIVENGLGGVILLDDEETTNTIKSYLYGESLTFNISANLRYELTTVMLNNIALGKEISTIKISQNNGFSVDETNVIKVKFSQLLWIDVWEMFGGTGTENDPYVISTPNQLAAMAYLINNNIEAKSTIPYQDGYYLIKANINLLERFWQPIGTQENPFNGTFDMRNYKIADIILDKSYAVTHLDGLFGYITDNAKFLTGPNDYSTAIIILSSSFAIIVIVIVLIFVIITRKKKRLRELSTAMTVQPINQNEENRNDEVIKKTEKDTGQEK